MIWTPPPLRRRLLRPSRSQRGWIMAPYRYAAAQELHWVTDSNTASWSVTGSGLVLTANNANSASAVAVPAITSGKRYFEIVVTGTINTGFPYMPGLGVVKQTFTTAQLMGNNSDAWNRGPDGRLWVNGSTPVTGLGTMVSGDVLMFALDVATLKLWLGRNGSWHAGGDPAAGTGQQATITGTAFRVGMCCNNGTSGAVGTLHGKASNVTYSPPSGFTGWGD